LATRKAKSQGSNSRPTSPHAESVHKHATGAVIGRRHKNEAAIGTSPTPVLRQQKLTTSSGASAVANFWFRTLLLKSSLLMQCADGACKVSSDPCSPCCMQCVQVDQQPSSSHARLRLLSKPGLFRGCLLRLRVNHLEGAPQVVSNLHQDTHIVELSTIVGCREEGN